MEHKKRGSIDIDEVSKILDGFAKNLHSEIDNILLDGKIKTEDVIRLSGQRAIIRSIKIALCE